MLTEDQRRAVSGTGHLILRYICGVGFMVGLLGLFSCPVILAYQILGWLNTGHWLGISLANWIVPSGSTNDFWRWLAEPQSWYGLQRLVRFLLYDPPVWMWLMMGGSYLIFISCDKLDKPFEDAEEAMCFFVMTNGKRYDTRCCSKSTNADTFLKEFLPPGWMLVGTAESEEEAEAIIEKDRALRSVDSY